MVFHDGVGPSVPVGGVGFGGVAAGEQGGVVAEFLFGGAGARELAVVVGAVGGGEGGERDDSADVGRAGAVGADGGGDLAAGGGAE
jgi:hypothetical protein